MPSIIGGRKALHEQNCSDCTTHINAATLSHQYLNHEVKNFDGMSPVVFWLRRLCLAYEISNDGVKPDLNTYILEIITRLEGKAAVFAEQSRTVNTIIEKAERRIASLADLGDLKQALREKFPLQTINASAVSTHGSVSNSAEKTSSHAVTATRTVSFAGSIGTLEGTDGSLLDKTATDQAAPSPQQGFPAEHVGAKRTGEVTDSANKRARMLPKSPESPLLSNASSAIGAQNGGLFQQNPASCSGQEVQEWPLSTPNIERSSNTTFIQSIGSSRGGFAGRGRGRGRGTAS